MLGERLGDEKKPEGARKRKLPEKITILGGWWIGQIRIDQVFSRGARKRVRNMLRTLGLRGRPFRDIIVAAPLKLGRHLADKR